jgi:hypothetical protein
MLSIYTLLFVMVLSGVLYLTTSSGQTPAVVREKSQGKNRSRVRFQR